MSGMGAAVPMTDDDYEDMDASDGTVVTVHSDGSVSFGTGAPAVHRRTQSDKDFGQNLAETLDDGTLAQLANDVLDGINADIISRQDFIQNYNNGIDLLPLKLDQASSVRGNRQSISRVKNPSLLQACMRSQSTSAGQLLPAEGPVKIQTVSGESGNVDEMARCLGQDLNYFLTDIDLGYYPDTERMLFFRAYGGSAYKKIYRDPILKRPSSRFTSLDSLIVSEEASDLQSAMRKTEEHLYSPVEVARMKKLGGWLDIDLGIPMQNLSPARRKMLESQGLSSASTRSQDISHTIYESYLSFCPEDYGWDDRKTELGLPAPYRLVMDRDSRKILGLYRNWRPKDELYRERQAFVKYGLVPGLGFLDYGFLHLIGNQTRVLTAIWQIMVDKGMLANFPGGMKVKGVKSTTNEINPGLGEWVEVDIGGANVKSIKDAMMGMPYGDVSDSLLKLAEMLQKDIDTTAGTIEIPTGQGMSNMPVGTILAMIEQQSQDLTAVQRRDHRSQREELRLLRDLFAEHPEDLVHLRRPGLSKFNWQEKITEFRNFDLVPVSDPNIPSQAHRILINQFLMGMAEKAPQLFGSKIRQLAKRILLGVGVNDAEDLLAPQPEINQALAQMSQGGGKGGGAGQASLEKTKMELPIKQAEVEIDRERLQLEQQESQREAANEAQDGQLRAEKHQGDMAREDAKLAQEERRLQVEEAQNTGSDPQAEAEMEATRAGAFASVATGVMSLAKAGQTAQQGEQEAKAIEEGMIPAGVSEPQPKEPKASLSSPQPKSKKVSGKKRASGK